MILTENCIFEEMAKKDYVLHTPRVIRTLSPNCNIFFKTKAKLSSDYLSHSKELFNSKKEKINLSNTKNFETYRKNFEDFNYTTKTHTKRPQTNHEPSRNQLKFQSMVIQQQENEGIGNTINNNNQKYKNKSIKLNTNSNKTIHMSFNNKGTLMNKGKGIVKFFSQSAKTKDRVNVKDNNVHNTNDYDYLMHFEGDNEDNHIKSIASDRIEKKVTIAKAKN